MARPPHIPDARERAALQKLLSGSGLSLVKLHPIGKHTVAKMLGKGWIERRSEIGGSQYYITPDGEKAFRVRIPM